jgi:glycosyltransferase involved in cell wall biosynthesis
MTAAASKPWLSILIPFHNVEDYLEACVASVVSQLLPGIEIITLDDCSTDASATRLNAYIATTQVTIRQLSHPQNAGISVARNNLVEAAQGDYLWFVDSDDILCPGALAKLKSIIDAHQPDLVLCDFFMLRARPQLKHRLRGELHRQSFGGPVHQVLQDKDALFFHLYDKGQLHLWTKISKRQLWGEDLRFPAGYVMEDMTLTPRLCLRAHTYYYCPEVWVGYRQRPGSILASPNLKLLLDTSRAGTGILEEWLREVPLSNKSRFAFAHFGAKSMIGISRILREQQRYADLAHHQAAFFTNTQANPRWLLWEYCKRGWWLRGLRLLKHLAAVKPVAGETPPAA